MDKEGIAATRCPFLFVEVVGRSVVRVPRRRVCAPLAAAALTLFHVKNDYPGEPSMKWMYELTDGMTPWSTCWS